MNKQIYIGGTPLIDLTGYATESYVQTAVDNVDVTDQLTNYVLKTTLDASYGALDASIKDADASITALKSTLAEITGEGADADTVINTWQELKNFVADYTTANDLSTLIATVKAEAVDDASADAAGKYQPIGSYLVADDISTFVDAGDVAAAINSSIAALDLANTYQPKGSYLVADDISTFVDAAAVSAAINSSIAALDLANTYQAKGDYLVADDISTFVDAAAVSTAINSSISALNLDQYAKDASLADYAKSTDIAATYQTKNDASNHVAGSGVTNIVKCTSTAYAAIEVKDANTLYIVTD